MPRTGRPDPGWRRADSQIVNNYSGISFNFGPTLLQWMEDAALRRVRVDSRR